MNGMQARTFDIKNRDGSTSKVIQIGVPADHPFAEYDPEIGQHGLHNIRIGPILLPAPPAFIIRSRESPEVPISSSIEDIIHIRREAHIP